MFEVGDVYQGRYLIESVVPFFQGELAIAFYNEQRYYLQSANMHKQAPGRAIAQYQNLQLPQVIPYREVIVEADMLVFVRPYIPIRPLREVIENQELSEEQVVKWVRELLHVEAVLRAKPMSMYLLLDLRNVGVTSQNELKVLFCGLEQIMVYESKLDWGTFIYSMLSGQFLDGPILKLPRNFKVSRQMARLIQKSFKVYKVSTVLEQVELFETKQSGGILSKLWGDKKAETTPLITPNINQEAIDSPIGRPIYRTSETGTHVTIRSFDSNPLTEADESHDSDKELVVERDTLKEEKSKRIQIADSKTEDQTNTPVTVQETREVEESVVEQLEEEKTEEQVVKEQESQENQEKEQTTEQLVEEKEASENRRHPNSSLTTVKVSPALAQLNGQDLTQSFIIKLNEQQEELEKEQQDRLVKIRQEFERKEQELIEQHRKKLEEEQQRLLEEQRKKLEQEQQDLLRKKREELAKKKEKERLEKERRRKAKLAEVRKEFETKQQQMLLQEEKVFQERQEALLSQLIAEFEERKQILLAEQQKEYRARTEQKLAELQLEWQQVAATTDGEVTPLDADAIVTPTQVTEESDKTEKISTEIESVTRDADEKEDSSMREDIVWEVEEKQFNDQAVPPTQKETIVLVDLESEPESSVVQEEKVETVSETVDSKPRRVTNDSTEETRQEEQVELVLEAVFGKPELIESEVKEVSIEEEPKPTVKAVFAEEDVPIEDTSKLQITSLAEDLEDDDVKDAGSSDFNTEGEEAPKKKKRRRRRRRKKKKSDDVVSTGEVATISNESTEEVAATSNELTEGSSSSIEDERRKRELELAEMERELLELEQQEKVQRKQELPTQPEKQKIKKIEPEPKQSPLPPVTQKKVEVPVVKDTTEHATLAKQFEQYLKLFRKKK